MWAAGWSYPSKAKRAVNGRAYHLDSVAYETRQEAVDRIKTLRTEEVPGLVGWYRGTTFFPVEVNFDRFKVGELDGSAEV